MRGDLLRGGPRLGVAGLVEPGVELALDPALEVPGGAPVPEQEQRRAGQPPAGRVTSAGSGMVGQSRHSRSSA